MTVVDKAIETQLSNIEKKTGKTRAALGQEILAQGLSKHGEMVGWVKAAYGLGHGDANTLVHVSRKSAEASPASSGDILDQIYTGPKAGQRAIHERLLRDVATFGAFEIAPKKGYVSLRRKKQFAMLGPKTNTRLELGLNLKEDVDHPRMKAAAPGGMCQYIVSLEAADQVDAALVALMRRAYDAAG